MEKFLTKLYELQQTCRELFNESSVLEVKLSTTACNALTQYFTGKMHGGPSFKICDIEIKQDETPFVRWLEKKVEEIERRNKNLYPEK